MSSEDHRQNQIGRPKSLNEKGERIFQYPAAVTGRFRTLRNRVYAFLIFLFLVLPWIKVGGYQSIWINIVDRHFTFFGWHFWAHDTPAIFFILAFLTLTLAFVTAIWGRVWCGWACPQTVFIDGVFRKIEEWVEGSHLARKKLDEAPWSGKKFKKKLSKWSLFVGVSFLISHSFAAYFVGADNVIQYIQGSPSEHWATFLFVMALTGLVLFDFAWFREQFCIIMCPYGRFQSVLMDKNSLTILYDEKRGEPRRSREIPKDQQGDCVDCFICVRACPTGIDIRDGVQLECIGCTACIDACDVVMEKQNKPKGLIRYDSEASISDGVQRKIGNVRIMVYMGMLLASLVGLFSYAANRDVVGAQLVRAIETPYKTVEVEGGATEVINHFKLKLRNNKIETVNVDIEAVAGDCEINMVKPKLPMPLKAGEKNHSHIFFRFSKDQLDTSGSRKCELRLKVTEGEFVNYFPLSVSLIGPI